MLVLRLPLTLATAFLTTTAPTSTTPQQDMSFFITSVGPGNGAALGGLEGADKHCATLAEAAGVRLPVLVEIDVGMARGGLC